MCVSNCSCLFGKYSVKYGEINYQSEKSIEEKMYLQCDVLYEAAMVDLCPNKSEII